MNTKKRKRKYTCIAVDQNLYVSSSFDYFVDVHYCENRHKTKEQFHINREGFFGVYSPIPKYMMNEILMQLKQLVKDDALIPYEYNKDNVKRFENLLYYDRSDLLLRAKGWNNWVSQLKPNKPMCYAGFISPKGELYSCPHQAHYELAGLIVKNYYHKSYKTLDTSPENYLHNKKWIHMQNNGSVNFGVALIKITQAQLNTLGDLTNCVWADEEFIQNSSYQGDRRIHGSAKEWKNNIMKAIHYAEVE